MRTHHRQAISFLKRLPVILTALVVTACASVQSGTGVNQKSAALSDTASAVSPETITTPTGVFAEHIQGILLDIDGKTPVAGATVYITNPKAAVTSSRMLNGLSLSSTSKTKRQSCVLPTSPYSSYTCTRNDGSFDLVINQVQQLPLPVIFTKGEQQVSISLDLNDLGSDIGEVAFDLPEKAQRKIAIVLDFFNPYEDIKHQLKTGHYNMREAFRDISNQMVQMFDLDKTKSKVMFPKFANLFEDWDGDHQIDLYKYDIIYINSRNSKDIASLSKEKRNELLNFISRGGQLFITEWKFELPEVPLDQYI